jgi:hypothetical protein
MDSDVSNIVTAVSTITAVIVGAILTELLSFKRSTKEKLLDMRILSYGRILSTLFKLESVVARADYYIEEDATRYFGSDIREAHDSEIAKHIIEIRDTLSDSYLIVSERSVDILEDFMEELQERPDDVFPEDHKRLLAAVRAARPRMMHQARTEMPS